MVSGSGGEECDESGADGHGGDIVDGGRVSGKDVKGAEDEDGEKEDVVVKDGEGGRLVLGDLVLFPQDPLVLLLPGNLLVVGQLGVHLLGHRRLALDGHLVL